MVLLNPFYICLTRRINGGHSGTSKKKKKKKKKIGPPRAELGALERLKKFPYTYYGEKGIATFSHLFLIGSFSYLQVTMTYIRAGMSLKFGQI